MSKNVAILLVLVFLLASLIVAAKPVSAATPVENSWTTKAPMRVARSDLGVAVVNGKIYAIGGSTTQGSPPHTTGEVVGTNEEYDPTTDTWTFKKPMPTARYGFATAVYQNKIYCIGGENRDGYTGANEVYDTATDTWETKAPIPTTRGGLKANIVNGKIYLIGGYVPDNSSLGSSILVLNEVYDPATDSWTTKAPVPTAVSSVLSAVVDSKIYVIMSDLNQIYDADTDTWSLGTPLPYSGMLYARAGAATGVDAPKRIYVFGGGRTQVYDPENESWTIGADVPSDHRGFGIAVVNDVFYLIGGSTLTYPNWFPYFTKYATNERYTPFGYGTIPHTIHVVSPENKNYTSGNVSLAFAVNKPFVWTGYSLDGQDNVTITGNTTLAGLSSGLHNITVYARDEFENVGASETITFNIQEPFPTAPVAAASAVTVAVVVGVGLLVYFKRRNH